jgi:hypothetical protein
MRHFLSNLRANSSYGAAVLGAIMALSFYLVAQPGYQPSPENLKFRAWF